MSQVRRAVLLPAVLLSLLSVWPAVPGGSVDTSSSNAGEEMASAHSQPCQTPTAVSRMECVCEWAEGSLLCV